MSTLNRPQVSDLDLQRTLDDVGPDIENYHANLDLVSNDIKAIEQYLAASGVRIRARIRIGGSGTRTDNEIDVMQNYSGRISEDDEYVEWGPDPKNADRWRVLWICERSWGELELCEGIAIAGPTFNGPRELVDVRPLLETPVETRIRAHQHLSPLLREVRNRVAVRPDETLRDEDVPF